LNRFDALSDQLATDLAVNDAILDGEVIAVDETGRPVFIDLLRRKQTPGYVAFDILWLGEAALEPTAALRPCREQCWLVPEADTHDHPHERRGRVVSCHSRCARPLMPVA